MYTHKRIELKGKYFLILSNSPVELYEYNVGTHEKDVHFEPIINFSPRALLPSRAFVGSMQILALQRCKFRHRYLQLYEYRISTRLRRENFRTNNNILGQQAATSSRQMLLIPRVYPTVAR